MEIERGTTRSYYVENSLLDDAMNRSQDRLDNESMNK